MQLIVDHPQDNPQGISKIWLQVGEESKKFTHPTIHKLLATF
jgi:hypothetical protein